MILSQNVHKKQIDKANRIVEAIQDEVIGSCGKIVNDYRGNQIEITITLPDIICENGICDNCWKKPACDEAAVLTEAEMGFYGANN